ncbi:hypothetical protein [Kibdelosporangium philippinense]
MGRSPARCGARRLGRTGLCDAFGKIGAGATPVAGLMSGVS